MIEATVTPLRKWLEENRMSQQELRRKVGYSSQPQFCLIVNGKANPSRKLAQKISEITNLPMEDLFID